MLDRPLLASFNSVFVFRSSLLKLQSLVSRSVSNAGAKLPGDLCGLIQVLDERLAHSGRLERLVRQPLAGTSRVHLPLFKEIAQRESPDNHNQPTVRRTRSAPIKFSIKIAIITQLELEILSSVYIRLSGLTPGISCAPGSSHITDTLIARQLHPLVRWAHLLIFLDNHADSLLTQGQ